MSSFENIVLWFYQIWYNEAARTAWWIDFWSGHSKWISIGKVHRVELLARWSSGVSVEGAYQLIRANRLSKKLHAQLAHLAVTQVDLVNIEKQSRKKIDLNYLMGPVFAQKLLGKSVWLEELILNF